MVSFEAATSHESNPINHPARIELINKTQLLWFITCTEIRSTLVKSKVPSFGPIQTNTADIKYPPSILPRSTNPQIANKLPKLFCLFKTGSASNEVCSV